MRQANDRIQKKIWMNAGQVAPPFRLPSASLASAVLASVLLYIYTQLSVPNLNPPS